MPAQKIITIDGPSGSGKGTIAQRLADRLGWRVLDSGALYRLVGLDARNRGLDAAWGRFVVFLDAGDTPVDGQTDSIPDDHFSRFLRPLDLRIERLEPALHRSLGGRD